MKAKRIFNKVVNTSGLTKAELARRMGRNDNYIRGYVTRGSIPKVDTFAEIADVSGYDLLVRHRQSGEEIIIDPPERQHADNKEE